MPKFKRQSGFTIIELIVVIVIIAILATIAIVSYTGTKGRANDARRLQDANAIQKALSLYKIRNGAFPASAPNPGSSTWEISTDPGFLSSINSVTNEAVFSDPINSGTSSYWYHSFDAGANNCPASAGSYYVLWLRGMQAQSAPKVDAPQCTGQTLFVTTPTTGAWTISATDLVIFRFN